MYCKNCGKEIADDAVMCPGCGSPVAVQGTGKSKMVAGLLAVFLGTFGIHNFYLGRNGIAIAQLLITVLGACIFIGPVITLIWSLVEAIMIFSGNIKAADGSELE